MSVRTLLLILTAVEVLLFVGVVAVYLIAIARSLNRTSGYLAKVTFGVRAIEKQAEPIGAGVTRINEQLAVIAAALDGVAGLAEDAFAGAKPRRRPMRARHDG